MDFRHGEYAGRPGRKASKEYEAWNSARYRCENPKHKAYPHYGGRGIQVTCTFAEMLADIGRCPTGCSLDRKDVNGDYAVGNLRWATRRVQRLNRRGRQRFTLDGEPVSLREMAIMVAMCRNRFRKLLEQAHVAKFP